MDSRKSVSVVITNFNGRECLADTLASVLAQDYASVESVALADNCSTDGSVEFVKERFPSVRILQTPGNRGPNVARNLGLNDARTDLVLIMDNDIVLAPDYIARAVHVFESDGSTGAVSGQIRLRDEPERVQYQGGVDIHYVAAAVQVRDTRQGISRVGAVSAGAMLVDRLKAIAAGGFDEDFVFGWEDGDFAFRLALAGQSNFVVPEAVCYHLKQKRGLKWVRHQVRNRWWFILKNYDAGTIALCWPAFLFYQCGIGGVCLIKGKGLDFIGGTWDALVSIPAVLKKRKIVQGLRRTPDSRLLCARDIDTLGDAGQSALVRAGNRVSNRVLGAYWTLVRRWIR